MQAVRGKTEDDISDFYFFTSNDLVAVHDANDETSKVILAVWIKARHFGSFSADKSTSIVLAGRGKAFDYLLSHFRIKFACSQVVHKEHRRRALDCDVIHAVVDQVPPYGGVEIHIKGDF